MVNQISELSNKNVVLRKPTVVSILKPNHLFVLTIPKNIMFTLVTSSPASEDIYIHPVLAVLPCRKTQ